MIPPLNFDQKINNEDRHYLTFVIFIRMESRITKKKTIEKSNLIVSMLAEKMYPMDVLELITEIGSKELFEWGKSKIDLLQGIVFKIPTAKFYREIQFVVRTIEIENEDEELLTIRYIFVGKINRSDAEDIGNKFRIDAERNFNGFVSMKFNKMEKIDLMVNLIPLQFYNPLLKKNQFHDELLDLVLNDSILFFPRIFLTDELFLNRDNLLGF